MVIGKSCREVAIYKGTPHAARRMLHGAWRNEEEDLFFFFF
jgi:hypothetical protein